MLDEAGKLGEDEGDYVEFFSTGTRVVGEYRCSGCGYGVTVHQSLPACPMCSGTSWEQVDWSPLARARRLQ
jgi:rubredoxin